MKYDEIIASLRSQGVPEESLILFNLGALVGGVFSDGDGDVIEEVIKTGTVRSYTKKDEPYFKCRVNASGVVATTDGKVTTIKTLEDVFACH